jgi:formylglycine-generating enzyme required for sulfatase activity
VGDDDPIPWSVPGSSGTTTAHVPRHSVWLPAYRIGQFAVTNAEWACFQAGGGYEDERWWDTADARRWRRGELPSSGALANGRIWRSKFLTEAGLLEQMAQEGRFPNLEAAERWREWLALDEAAFEAELERFWRPQREREPRYWRDGQFNQPSQPVVGVCWYEARAYGNWLSAQLGQRLRLPSEVEWEAAARGPEARRYPWGDDFEPLRANTYETRIKRSTPVGVFPAGDSWAGVADLAGNVYDLTLSLFGAGAEGSEVPQWPYPYVPGDGRQAADAAPEVRRVVRGGSWNNDRSFARSAYRDLDFPDFRYFNLGFRLALEGE